MTGTTVSKEPRYTSLEGAAKHRNCTTQSIENYVQRGWIRGFLTASGTLLVDLNDFEEAQRLHPRMKKPKPRFAPTARIQPLPARVSLEVEQ